MPHGEEGLKATCWSVAEAAEKPKPVMTPLGSTATSKRKPSYHPRRLDHPMCRPNRPAILRLGAWRPYNGHRRAVQGFVRAALGLHHVRQMQGHLLDEIEVVAHQPVELRAVGQGGEGVAPSAARVTVEIPFACEAGPPGEDGQSDDLAGAQGCIGSGMLPFFAGGTGSRSRPS